MPIEATKYIWHNGKLVPWEKATVHVLCHALHYGSSVFEGIRVYETPDGARIFRLQDHTKRLFHSAKVYRLPMPYSEAELNQACHQVLVSNKLLSGAYIRPIAFRGYGEMGVAPTDDLPTEVSVAAWQWGAYLGTEGQEHGVDVCISTWHRVAPNTIPAGAKAGGNYLSSQLITMEAQRLGFAEGIGLTTDGLVSEGAGENLFLAMDGTLYTPPAAASILSGLTRDTVIKLARDLGIEVNEQAITREMLYFCDEMFLTGTAVEITPVRSVDRLPVGAGKRGPLTESLQKQFFGLFTGETEDKWSWLEPVEESTPVSVAI